MILQVRFEGKILQIYRNKAGGSLVYHGDLVTIEKRLNGDIHLYNKSGNSLIFWVLDALPEKWSKLPLPPVISEDPKITKLNYMTQLQEDRRIKQQERNKRNSEERANLSLLRQEFYRVHSQWTPFDASWRST